MKFVCYLARCCCALERARRTKKLSSRGSFRAPGAIPIAGRVQKGGANGGRNDVTRMIVGHASPVSVIFNWQSSTLWTLHTYLLDIVSQGRLVSEVFWSGNRGGLGEALSKMEELRKLVWSVKMARFGMDDVEMHWKEKRGNVN